MKEGKNRIGRKSMMLLQAALCLCSGILPVSAYNTFDVGPKTDDSKTQIKSTSKSRDTISALAASGWKKWSNGDSKGAWQDFTQAIAQNPGDADARAGRSSIYMAMGQYNGASSEANYAVFADPDNLQGRWVRALVNSDINKFADARDDFKFVIAANPDIANAHLYLGEAYRNLGDRRAAYNEYTTAAKMLAQTNPKQAKKCSYWADVVNPNPGSVVGRDLGASIVVENLAQVYKASPKPENGRAIFAQNAKWPVGHTIKVAFNGGDPELRKVVADTVPEWSKYGNIKFDFIDPATGKYREWSTSDTKYNADIRIGFGKDGYWSVIGQQSISVVRPNEKSMNLDPTGWKEIGTYFTGTILHEFGHALGFLHEHQHPFAGGMTEIRWQDDFGYVPTKDNRGVYMADSAGRLPGLLSYFVTTQGWSPDLSYSQIATYEDTDQLALGPLDTTSIMQYAQTPFLLKTGKASPAYADENSVLSAGDKVAIQKQYPGPTSLSGGH